LFIFVQGTIDNVGDIFSGLLFLLTHISLDLLSLCSAKLQKHTLGKAEN